MKMITLYLPEKYLELLDEIIDAGHFPNRSEAIRSAIRDLLKYEFSLMGKNEKDKRLDD